MSGALRRSVSHGAAGNVLYIGRRGNRLSGPRRYVGRRGRRAVLGLSERPNEHVVGPTVTGPNRDERDRGHQQPWRIERVQRRDRERRHSVHSHDRFHDEREQHQRHCCERKRSEQRCHPDAQAVPQNLTKVRVPALDGPRLGLVAHRVQHDPRPAATERSARKRRKEQHGTE